MSKEPEVCSILRSAMQGSVNDCINASPWEDIVYPMCITMCDAIDNRIWTTANEAVYSHMRQSLRGLSLRELG